jgi:hypothetical protein
MTYGGQGCGKNGVLKWQHAIIYTGRREPAPQDSEKPSEGEYSMMTSIRVRPATKQGKLDPLSRINFGKIYTVEHNVKAFDFGNVDAADIKTLKVQWRYVLKRNMQGEVEEDEDDDEDDESPYPLQFATGAATGTAQGGQAYGPMYPTPIPGVPGYSGNIAGWSNPVPLEDTATGHSKGKGPMRPDSEEEE